MQLYILNMYDAAVFAIPLKSGIDFPATVSSLKSIVIKRTMQILKIADLMLICQRRTFFGGVSLLF